MLRLSFLAIVGPVILVAVRVAPVVIIARRRRKRERRTNGRGYALVADSVTSANFSGSRYPSQPPSCYIARDLACLS